MFFSPRTQNLKTLAQQVNQQTNSFIIKFYEEHMPVLSFMKILFWLAQKKTWNANKATIVVAVWKLNAWKECYRIWTAFRKRWKLVTLHKYAVTHQQFRKICSWFFRELPCAAC